jgi:hypothetical protein
MESLIHMGVLFTLTPERGDEILEIAKDMIKNINYLHESYPLYLAACKRLENAAEVRYLTFCYGRLIRVL